jgi:nucleotide-binding universal stress UspA family protein
VSDTHADEVATGLPRQVIVPLDGSDTGARALPFGHAFAGHVGAEVVTVHVGGQGASPGGGEPEVHADVYLQGDPVDALLEFAHAEPGRVLCVSSHGRTGLRRALLGSVAERLVRRAEVPVVVIGPEVEIRPPVVLPRTMVVAIGSGRDTHGAAALARRWAPLIGARIERVHVGPRAPEVEATPGEGLRVVDGDDPAAALLELADELPGPLLYVVGAPPGDSSRPGRAVALQLIRHARGPVLTHDAAGG